MSVVRGEARRRWLVVAALVAALCAVPFAVAAYPVGSTGPGPADLRRLILASSAKPYEGLAETRGSLGLPALPGLEDATTLLGGTNRLRVWYAAPQQWRVAMLTAAGERSFQQNAEDLTIWDYEREQLTKVRGRPPVRLPNATDLTPPALARRLLGLAAPGDPVSGLPAKRVAGRTVAGLRVTPADAATTIGAVDIWADPRTGVPVEVRIVPRSSGRAALTSRFLDLAQKRPAASALAPRHARGVRVITVSAPDLLSRIVWGSDHRVPDVLGGRPALETSASVSSIRAYRDGFATFLVAPLPGRYGRRIFDAAKDAGAPEARLPSGQAVLVRTSLLTAAVLDAAPGERGGRLYLILGAAGSDRVTAIARELAG